MDLAESYVALRAKALIGHREDFERAAPGVFLTRQLTALAVDSKQKINDVLFELIRRV